MTFRVEVDGMAVPESVTAGATSHREAAERVAHVNYAGKIVTVEQSVGGEIDRRWFEIVADPQGGQNSVIEAVLTAGRVLVQVERRDD